MALDNLKQCWATPNFVALNQQSPFLCIRIVDKFGSSLSLPAVKFQKILFQKNKKKKKKLAESLVAFSLLFFFGSQHSLCCSSSFRLGFTYRGSEKLSEHKQISLPFSISEYVSGVFKTRLSNFESI